MCVIDVPKAPSARRRRRRVRGAAGDENRDAEDFDGMGVGEGVFPSPAD